MAEDKDLIKRYETELAKIKMEASKKEKVFQAMSEKLGVKTSDDVDKIAKFIDQNIKSVEGKEVIEKSDLKIKALENQISDLKEQVLRSSRDSSLIRAKDTILNKLEANKGVYPFLDNFSDKNAIIEQYLSIKEKDTEGSYTDDQILKYLDDSFKKSLEQFGLKDTVKSIEEGKLNEESASDGTVELDEITEPDETTEEEEEEVEDKPSKKRERRNVTPKKEDVLKGKLKSYKDIVEIDEKEVYRTSLNKILDKNEQR